MNCEGLQLGAAQTETVAHPGECRHFGHATKLHSFKSHNTTEDPGSGAHIGDCWHSRTLETKVTPSRGLREGVYHGPPTKGPLVCFAPAPRVVWVVGLFTWIV